MRGPGTAVVVPRLALPAAAPATTKADHEGGDLSCQESLDDEACESALSFGPAAPAAPRDSVGTQGEGSTKQGAWNAEAWALAREDVAEERGAAFERLREDEGRYMAQRDYLQRQPAFMDDAMRRAVAEALDKVCDLVGFDASTFVLAMNIFDRFLSRHTLQEDLDWLPHFVGIAALSIAAKTEEVSVPFLTELFRVHEFARDWDYDSRAKAEDLTALELLVLDELGWAVHAVTPHSYLHGFMFAVGFGEPGESPTLCRAVYGAAAGAVRRLAHRGSCMDYRPSEAAAAAVLTAMMTDPTFCRQRASKAWYSRAESQLLALVGGGPGAKRAASGHAPGAQQVLRCIDAMLDSAEAADGGDDHRYKGLPGSPPSPLELSQFEEFADLGGDYDGACYREYKSPRHYEGSRPGSAAGGRGAARR